MIAVDILTRSQRKLIKNATLLTNDQDFYPVVVAARELGVKVHLICDPDKTNDEFMYLSDNTTKLSLNLFHSWVSEDTKSEYPLPKMHQKRKDAVAMWTIDNINISRTNDGYWEIWETEGKYRNIDKDLARLLEFSVFKWPDLDGLQNLLQSARVDGDAAIPT